MLRSKFYAFWLAAVLMGGLAACSFSSGDGGRRPADVTVVTPPNSSATVNQN